ncbi:hypothetical protein [Burkholderia cenocepacia]|uniref:hypothetical protein n=1 Tax=Burkholderia cenocepacia TaxID=95486 RepID=UPI001ED8CCA0|nr:hypothetical protein [Burkholderia cenocepacia]
MTENQSAIEENEMNNCAGKSLKFFDGLPLTPRRHIQQVCGVRRIAGIADIHCFIHAPPNPLY